MEEIFFFANAGSRRSKAEFPKVEQLLTESGIPLTESALLSSHDELDARVKEAVDAGAKLVIVGGGDGTLGTMARHFVESSCVFGAIPLGTGNQFAHEISMPIDLAAAVVAIREGRTARVDLGMLNGHSFLTVATLGMTTMIVRNLGTKQIFGKASYIPAVYQAAKKTKPFRVEIEGVRERIEQDNCIQVVVSNGRTHGGPFIASPDATVTDGMFDIYAIPRLHAPTAVAAVAYALVGRHVEFQEIDAMKTNKARIRTDPRLPVVIDGEESWFDEIELELLPNAIEVIVGEAFRAPEERRGRIQVLPS